MGLAYGGVRLLRPVDGAGSLAQAAAERSDAGEAAGHRPPEARPHGGGAAGPVGAPHRVRVRALRRRVRGTVVLFELVLLGRREFGWRQPIAGGWLDIDGAPAAGSPAAASSPAGYDHGRFSLLMIADTLRRSFRAMGTDASFIVDGRTDPRVFFRAVDIVEQVFAREERTFSRFRPDSELCGVNQRAGQWTRVSPGFGSLMRFSLRAAEQTNGSFDPTVLPALVAAGYDRDFDEILAGARVALHPAVPCGRWQEIQLDGDFLRLPVDVALDFGGVAKGWAADLAATAARSGPEVPWAVVNAGGDLRLVGHPPVGGIDLGVEDPESREHEIIRVQLEKGAVATSSVTSRAWGPGLHHLIDPRTSRPADTGVVQATVWAETCAEAEILSKWALLTGPGALDTVPGLMVMTDGHVEMSMQVRERALVGA